VAAMAKVDAMMILLVVLMVPPGRPLFMTVV
jgi:hypothetical protein